MHSCKCDRGSGGGGLIRSLANPMEPLTIAGTKKTPAIDFNAVTGVLEIRGRSLSENPNKFFAPAMTWLDNYSEAPHRTTTMNFQMDYYNSSSAICIVNIMYACEALQKAGGSEVEMNWYYEADDEVVRNEGETYQEIIQFGST